MHHVPPPQSEVRERRRRERMRALRQDVAGLHVPGQNTAWQEEGLQSVRFCCSAGDPAAVPRSQKIHHGALRAYTIADLSYRRAILLEETRRDLVDALEAIGAGSTLRAPTLSAASPSSPSSSIGQVAPSASGSSLESVPQETLASLENPLAILASLSLSDSASDSSRATERGGWTTQAQRFYSTGRRRLLDSPA